MLDSLRGEHSTGVAFINTTKDISLAKTVGDPFQLFDTLAFGCGMRQANKVLIGHNRFATVGRVIRKNAHPFLTGSIVGAHNGTLDNKHILEDSFKFDTDSEALFNSINIKGAKKTLEPVSGAYALTWYDADVDAMCLMRNKERPLHCVYSKDRKVIFWASEAWMLYAILNREKIEHEDIWEIPADKKFTFHLPERMKEFPNPDIEDIVQKQPETSFQRGGYMGHSTTAKTTKPHINNVISLSQGALKGKLVSLMPRWVGGKGGVYFVQFNSLEHPNTHFRVFRSTLQECQDILAKGNCSGIVSAFKNGSDIKYYKLSADALHYMAEKKDHRGNPISLETFLQKYRTCTFCSSDLDYTEDFRIMSGAKDSCLCANCASDEEILKYLPTCA